MFKYSLNNVNEKHYTKKILKSLEQLQKLDAVRVIHYYFITYKVETTKKKDFVFIENKFWNILAYQFMDKDGPKFLSLLQ